MQRSIIIALLSFCCFFCFSQTLSFTKTFKTKRKNVVVGIINNHSSYFHVLRYNKTVHDITLERRGKPGGEMLSFTPLKLDSVNAGWFNYEKLDYLFWEEDHRVVFVFEKTLNTKSTIYMKVIDSLGRSSGFIEVSTTEVEPGVSTDHIFSKGENNTLLVIASATYPNGVTKKTALLYDVKNRLAIWTKKLPHENSYKERTEGFTVNAGHDLFYIHYDFRSASLIKIGLTERLIINEFSEIKIIRSASSSKEINSRPLNLKGIEAVYSATLIPNKEDIIFSGHLVEEDLGKKPFLYVEKMNAGLTESMFQWKHPFPLNISEQLTFYDGSEQKDPAFKNYTLKNSFCAGENLYLVSERKHVNYYKELLSWHVDLKTGLLKKMEVIPRKIFYFDDRTRFKKMGECMMTSKRDSLRFYMMEDKANLSILPPAFKYHDFSKQTNLWGGNIVSYISGEHGSTRKKIIYTNKNFDLIPVTYLSTDANDEVFYFNEGTYEKFGFISLSNP
jgi:hypothetical protein